MLAKSIISNLNGSFFRINNYHERHQSKPGCQVRFFHQNSFQLPREANNFSVNSVVIIAVAVIIPCLLSQKVCEKKLVNIGLST